MARPATVIPLQTARGPARAGHVCAGVHAGVPGGEVATRRHAPGGDEVPGRQSAPGGGPVVLTRRGRVVVTGALALVAAGVFLVLPRVADATGTGVSPVRPDQNLSQVAVRPGDTLWSIAVRADRRADPRLVVQRITDMNSLAGAGVTPGQVLWVPKD
jgi:hypothetical protein